MEIKIYINGPGFEIATGKFSRNDIKNIQEYCNKNNVPIQDFLRNIYWENYDHTETLDNDGDWACDNISYNYGPDFYQSQVFVDYNENRHKELNMEVIQCINDKEENIKQLDEESQITFVSKERGALKTGVINLDKDQIWDETKLKIHTKTVLVDGQKYCIIYSLSYDGIEIEDEGPDGTQSTGFEYHITQSKNK